MKELSIFIDEFQKNIYLHYIKCADAHKMGTGIEIKLVLR